MVAIEYFDFPEYDIVIEYKSEYYIMECFIEDLEYVIFNLN